MNWNKDKSITLSRFFVVAFAILLALLDIFCYWILGWLKDISELPQGLSQTWLVLLTLYVSSLFAGLLLAVLWKLLGNLQHEKVFVSENVKFLRISSWACTAISLIYLLSAVYYIPMLVVAISAGFLALIIRIVKNVFEQANAMKYELDLTV